MLFWDGEAMTFPFSQVHGSQPDFLSPPFLKWAPVTPSLSVSIPLLLHQRVWVLMNRGGEEHGDLHFILTTTGEAALGESHIGRNQILDDIVGPMNQT